MKTAIEIVVVLAFIAFASWYSCAVYTECREAGGGAFLCWHVMSRK